MVDDIAVRDGMSLFAVSGTTIPFFVPQRCHQPRVCRPMHMSSRSTT